ncbi:DivIVA domain-containing protein [Vallitalea longa]|uniref:DivIVA domain-containing protein n=1 Tax=Vallitalea longa TaxID=2936439 RepID=A0A9W5Y806_9FIRM|nr:DivIVA domain-containing protein [Vallitalea longa]GKX28792.1 DivIVA domain-containing protein [Vallitalea longa]
MLTPLDIEAKNFKKTLFGFSQVEVRNTINEILSDYEKIYKENIELKDKVNLLNEGIKYYKTIEETLQSTLLLAEKTAEETKSNAHKRAEIIEKEAEVKAQTIVEDARNEVYRISQKKEELVQQYDASKIQIRQFLKAQLELTNSNTLENKPIDIDEIMKQQTIEEAAATNIDDISVKQIDNE